jgi:two-component system, chemotaxis family, CheB/CheR fusion protein
MSQDVTVERQFVPVCAIGASAGGVGALKELFRHLPDDLGLAYVVILHLAPDHPSTLDQILASVTGMAVTQVTDRSVLKPDCVYVIPPDRELVIEGDDVHARPFLEPRGHRAPIDMFFRSVAAGRGDGLAMILSGSGSDGSLGVQDMKEAGGVIFVQEPTSAEFGMMPRSAIATGVADFVSPIPRLVERVVEVAKSKDAVRSLSGEPVDQLLQRAIGFLKLRTGHDFAGYKRATVMRRVLRRLQVTRSPDLSAYLDYLMSNPEEAKNLLSDLLISVTSFFRDQSAYEALAKDVIGPMLEKFDDDGIRVWVAGCATGEEPYSLGILFLEEAARRKVSVPIQIFGTDLDKGALATGREGRYPASIEADVSQERLDRFFVREGAHYRVTQQLRDVVLFAEHSTLKDPPFMRLNLISCRNLLIYLERELQRQVCALFAYGLKPHGYLFLGSAETTDVLPDLFAPINREARIYRATEKASSRPAVISQFPAEHRPQILNDEPRQDRHERHRTVQSAHLDALEKSGPPSVLVDRNYQVLNLSERAGRFLVSPAGPPTNDITALARPELRLDVRTTVRHAFDTGATTLTRPVPVGFNGSRHLVSLHVGPGAVTEHGAAGEALIVFLDGGPVQEAAEPFSGEVANNEVRRLREELHTAEGRLAAARADNETAIQDLRVANEELQSINEEYRSTSEELETSKEELQSVNEELQTVNAELKSKLQAVATAHNDLRNLVTSSDIGTLFLDPKLRIKMFTPRVAEIFNITEADVGRVLSNFTHHLHYGKFEEDAAQVMKKLAAIEREVETRDGRWLMMRIRPYRTVDDRIDGIVATFVDITERREAHVRLGESEERQSFLLSLSDAVRTLADAAEIQARACRLVADRLAVDRTFYFEVDEAAGVARVEHDHVNGGQSTPSGKQSLADFTWSMAGLRGNEFHAISDVRTSPIVPDNNRTISVALGIISCMSAPILKNGKLVGALCVTSQHPREWTPFEMELLREVAERFWAAVERARAEATLKESEARYRKLFNSITQGFCVIELLFDEEDQPLDFRFINVNEAFERQTGLKDVVGRTMRSLEPDHEEYWFEIYGRIAKTGKSERFEAAAKKLGRYYEVSAFPFGPPEGRQVGVLFNDVAARKLAEVALRESEARFRQFGDASSDVLWIRDAKTLELEYCSPAFATICGIDPDSSNGRSNDPLMDLIVPEDRERTLAAIRNLRDEDMEYEYRIQRATDGEIRWLRTAGFRLVDPDGLVLRLGGITHDMTVERRNADRMEILLAELQHRTRNLIAVVHATASRTMRTSASLEQFSNGFFSRLDALARVNSLLSRLEDGERVTFDQLLETELSGHGIAAEEAGLDGKLGIDGAKGIALPSASVQTLAIALHELLTNATKHGALSTAEGRLRIAWKVVEHGGDPWLRFEWRETGVQIEEHDGRAGPEIGYGRELIERALPFQLDARTSYTLEHGELLCVVSLPVESRSNRRKA